MFDVSIGIGQSGVPVKIASAFQEAGPGGWRFTLTETGTMSCVLYQNTNPPGTVLSASNLTTVAYYDSNGAIVTAGTALTATGYVTVDAVNQDVYVIATLTGLTSAVNITRQISPVVGAEPAEGNLSADNPTYTGTLVETQAQTTPGALAATQFTGFASAVHGATLMGYGTTYDAALKNRAGTTVVGVGPNTTTTTVGGSLVLAGGTPAVHAINLEGLTLAANTNAIRGASVNPTRASGWTSFSGTVSTAPAAVYTDYRELHSTGAAEVLGFGHFSFMDSGATGKSMYALQAIAEADAGATVGAATAVGDGVFALWGKCLINGAGVNASGVAAAAWLSFQANVTDVQALDTSMINMEVASGGINAIFKFQCSAAKGATYFVNFEDNGEPAEKTTAKTTATNNVVGNIKVLVGDQVGYINIHSAKAT